MLFRLRARHGPGDVAALAILSACHPTAHRSAGVMPQTVRGRHGSCSCASQTSSGVERTYPQLAFGVRLVEFAEPHRDVAGDDDRAPASGDHDHVD